MATWPCPPAYAVLTLQGASAILEALGAQSLQNRVVAHLSERSDSIRHGAWDHQAKTKSPLLMSLRRATARVNPSFHQAMTSRFPRTSVAIHAAPHAIASTSDLGSNDKNSLWDESNVQSRKSYVKSKKTQKRGRNIIRRYLKPQLLIELKNMGLTSRNPKGKPL